MTASDEKNIINKVLKGDTNAFEGLVLEHQNNVYNLALKIMKNHEDALDISQEAFLKVYRKLGDFRFQSKFSVWLYRITYNLCIDAIRRNKNVQNVSLDTTDSEYDTHTLQIPDACQTPEEQIIEKEKKDIIVESIDKLSKEHREILLLREVTGMNYDEISSALNLSLGTVQSRISRARKNLVKILRDKGTFPDSYRQKNREEVR